MPNRPNSWRKPTRADKTKGPLTGAWSWGEALQVGPLAALLRAGIGAVPRVSFALGVLGVIAAGLIVAKIAGSPVVGAVAFVVMLAAMILLLIFQAAPPGAVHGPARLIFWSVAILFVAALCALFAAAVLWGLSLVPRGASAQVPHPATGQAASDLAPAPAASAASSISAVLASSLVVSAPLIVDKHSYFKRFNVNSESDQKEAEDHWGVGQYPPESSWYSTREWHRVRDCLWRNRLSAKASKACGSKSGLLPKFDIILENNGAKSVVVREMKILMTSSSSPQGDGTDVEHQGGVPEGVIPPSAQYSVVVEPGGDKSVDILVPSPFEVLPGRARRITLTIDRQHFESTLKVASADPMVAVLVLQVRTGDGLLASSPEFALEYP